MRTPAPCAERNRGRPAAMKPGRPREARGGELAAGSTPGFSNRKGQVWGSICRGKHFWQMTGGHTHTCCCRRGHGPAFRNTHRGTHVPGGQATCLRGSLPSVPTSSPRQPSLASSAPPLQKGTGLEAPACQTCLWTSMASLWPAASPRVCSPRGGLLHKPSSPSPSPELQGL